MFAGVIASSMQPLLALADSDLDGDQQNSYSFSMEFGEADPDRMLVAFIGLRDNSFGVLPNFSTVTIGGVTATVLQNTNRSQWRLGVFAVELPAGTSGTVAVTLTGSANNCDVGLFSARRLRVGVVDSDIATAGGLSAGVSLQVTGAGVACGGSLSDRTDALTWTGLTAAYAHSDSEGDLFAGGLSAQLAQSAAYAISAAQPLTGDRIVAGVSLF